MKPAPRTSMAILLLRSLASITSEPFLNRRPGFFSASRFQSRSSCVTPGVTHSRRRVQKSAQPGSAIKSGPFRGRDLGTAEKCGVLINHEARRFDVTAQRATRLELAAFCRENISLDRPLHDHRFRPDFPADVGVLPDG